MPPNRSADIELRALAVFEELADSPDDHEHRERVLGAETVEVRMRVLALEAHANSGSKAMATLMPGDCGGNECDPPGRVGAFDLKRLIGRGGMGDVWLAHRSDGLYEQTVAIKLIQRRPRAVAAFNDERRFLAQLEHPNIARLIDGGVTHNGLPWLAMEFVNGRSIEDAATVLALPDRLRLFIEAASAVQFAHSRMIAHGDIKPSNILVDDDKRVKLLDFGVAGMIGGDGLPTPRLQPLTPEFASPQRREGAGPSVRDDVYALGKTLERIIQGAGDRELRAITATARSDSEGERYSSVAEFIADIERWQTKMPVTAMPDTSLYRASKFADRHRRSLSAATAAFLLLLSTSVIATFNYFAAERSRAQAELRFDEVRELARFLLFDQYDSLARQPGAVALRAAIASEAAAYLDRLASSGGSRPDLQLDTARGYRRLAAIEGLPSTPNLGNPGNAAQALERAERILQALIERDARNAEALAEMGWVYADRWTLRGDNFASPKTNAAALSYFTRALELDPDSASAALGVIVAEKSAGYDLIWGADQPAAALPVLEEALAHLRSRRWPLEVAIDAAMLEINILNRLGDASYYAGDVEGSLTFYREAASLIDYQIGKDGSSPQWLILKGESAFNISGSLGEIDGGAEEALAVAREGEAVLKKLLALGPDAAAEKKLLVLYGQEALLLGDAGKMDEALIPSTASVRLRADRLADSQDDPQRMRDFAIGLAAHAELLGEAKKPADACVAATQAVAEWAEIGTAGHLGALDKRKNQPNAIQLQKKFCRPS